VIGVLLLLLAAAAGPVIYAGFQDLHSAQAALAGKKYEDAAQHFEAAAGHLPWRGDLWERAGLAAYLDQDNAETIRLLETARRKEYLSAQGWDALGSAYWNADDRQTALAVWQAAVRAYPDDVPLYDRLAMAYHENGDLASEEQALIKRLSLAPAASAHYQLGLLLLLSDPSRALNELTSAASMDPQFDPALQTLRAALAVSAAASHPADRYVAIGRGLGLVEEWTLAQNAFGKAVAADGQDAEAWAWLGEARQHNGGDGRADLERALALGPEDAIVHALRGLYWRRQGSYAQALTEYSLAGRIQPDNPAWQASIGDAEAQTGDLVSALAAYQKAAQAAPNDAAYWSLLAMFCSDNDLHVLDIGLPAAQQAARLAPDDPQTLDVLGWSFSNAGLLYTAQQDLQRAIKLAPDLALAHLHLAENYLRQGDRASARAELDLTLELDKDGAAGQTAAQLLRQYFPQ